MVTVPSISIISFFRLRLFILHTSTTYVWMIFLFLGDCYSSIFRSIILSYPYHFIQFTTSHSPLPACELPFSYFIFGYSLGLWLSTVHPFFLESFPDSTHKNYLYNRSEMLWFVFYVIILTIKYCWTYLWFALLVALLLLCVSNRKFELVLWCCTFCRNFEKYNF